MKLYLNILLDGKPAAFMAKLHAQYQKDANSQIYISAPTEYKSGSVDWDIGTTKLFYDGPGRDAPTGISFSNITPADTQASTGQDLTYNVNFASTSTSLYLGIGAVALAVYFFFKKKSAPALAQGGV